MVEERKNAKEMVSVQAEFIRKIGSPGLDELENIIFSNLRLLQSVTDSQSRGWGCLKIKLGVLPISDGLRVKSKSKKWLCDLLLTSEIIRVIANIYSVLYTGIYRNLKVIVHSSLIQQSLQSLVIGRHLELFSKNSFGYRK